MTPEKHRYDVLIAHGKNWRMYPPSDATPETFQLELSLESKMTALAAWEFYDRGNTERVLFSTGKTAGQAFPSESRAMVSYLEQTGRIFPDKVLLYEETSFDTPGNAQESKKILEQTGLKKVALVTVKDHLPRTVGFYAQNGVPIDATYASEDIVQKISPRHAQFVDRYSRSLRRRSEQAKEILLRAETKIDKHGYIPRLLTKKLRHQ